MHHQGTPPGGCPILSGPALFAGSHRAVDAEAGVPEGSTSYYFRTRDALLRATLDRLAERDEAAMWAQPQAVAAIRCGEPADLGEIADGVGTRLNPDQLADVIAQVLVQLLTAGRDDLLARIELTLEATRRPQLREVLQALGDNFRSAAARLLAAAGSVDPERHSRQLVAYLDGLLFAHTNADIDPTTDCEPLRLAVRDLLRGMLDQRPSKSSPR